MEDVLWKMEDGWKVRDDMRLAILTYNSLVSY